ncbi:MAG TPA: permease-like cell division protein FtsX [Bacillota bacterium]|nr:permease-like cell division protein FtsX [Bacillota bacterium]HOH10224.1 permease-like cell division protein FtsX [Bacillota bacterium]HOY89031.1 permease-like cell division protein FtsX [Bacillota bacterium]HPI01186.1 permease-like cell division protein FtsX [Bacillota bacterium]HPM63561.1 permease-like cell division protein FtsX [Bacillota bacterium]
MKARSVKLIAGQTARGLFRNFALMALVVVAACMFVLGSTLAVALNVTNIGLQLQRQVEIKAFLMDGLKDYAAVGSRIKAVPGVADAIYISKEEALKRMAEDYPDYREVIKTLPDNPLPASFDVKLSDPKSVKEIAGAVGGIEGVEGVNYGQSYVEGLSSVLQVLWSFTALVLVAMVFGSSIIVNNTIGITVTARRNEIEIMKLVGASDGFIRAPFVLEGMIIGFVGSLLAGIGIIAGYEYAARWVKDMAPFVPLVDAAWAKAGLLAVVLALGAVLGAGAGRNATNRYLKD